LATKEQGIFRCCNEHFPKVPTADETLDGFEILRQVRRAGRSIELTSKEYRCSNF
jgi:hypothetical protein